jgi:putative DNA primase/helicase
MHSDFRSKLIEVGIVPSKTIHADGNIHRLSVDNKPSCKKNGWYILYEGQFGVFGRWDTEETYKWTDKSIKSLADEKRIAERINSIINEKKKKIAENYLAAGKRAEFIWKKADLLTEHDHPYLINKKINSFILPTIRKYKNQIVVPVMNQNAKITSLQFINEKGDKNFLKYGQVKGCCCPLWGEKDVMILCEGYATGATIHAATQKHVICTFNSGNLINVAKLIRQKRPSQQILIAGDDDPLVVTKKIKNPGRTKALQAAKECQAYTVFPEFSGAPEKNKTDFNDLFVHEGFETVKNQIMAVVSQIREENDHSLAI